ncbi:MAG: hypothetical protein A2Y12_09760 [Planctomycetes bacterium GWF2_42_9]|nr:MAG: hypothetical protein A2Y12_09760 [Planctomycetes bacterium GWF2_42_9]
MLLESTTEMQIDDLFIRPFFDESKIVVTFTKPKGFIKVDYEVFGNSTLIAGGTISDFVSDRVVFEQIIPNFKAWSDTDPFLYLLRLKIDMNGDVRIFEQPFGITKIHVLNRMVFLNNYPLYIRGHIRGRDAHDHPNFLGCSEREFYEKSIKVSKSFGFNFVRFHSRIPSDEFLKAADELGFLCQVEIRPYFGKYQKEREATKFDEDQTLVTENEWRRMILKLRNHPCVLVYCMGNEINSPGCNERVKIIRELTKSLDPTRLFLDTCSRGEYDRNTADLDVQHMSYFAPFGKNYNMFDDSIHLAIYGSVTKKKMVVQDDCHSPTAIARREVAVKFPLLAHEVCHYLVLRDPYKLKERFRKNELTEPWWIDELITLIKAKGHEKNFQKMLRASTRFQYIWIKQCIESIRKSSVLQGFHMLQFADTDRYENANGLVDCFDDIKDISPELFCQFNSPTVLIADLPKRVFHEGTKIIIPIYISHFTQVDHHNGGLHWKLKSEKEEICFEGFLDQIKLADRGTRRICRVEINLPKTSQPEHLVFACDLVSESKVHIASNSWDLWLFPNRPESIAGNAFTVSLNHINLCTRYPQLKCKQYLKVTEQIFITDHFDERVLDQLKNGKDVLVLYRIDENRNKHASKEKYYLPSTWDRFKGVIWDRGHNCGGLLKDHPITDNFPHDGFIDWQFYNLIEDSDKIDLDDFPVKLEPIIEGVDKAVRDRFDVGRFNLSEFQYEYTMRKFAYLFELNVGSGRLVVTGMNFKGIETDEPAVSQMFENILNYMQSEQFRPHDSLPYDEFEKYLLNKGKSKRIKERMMTQYWQLDDSPLESKQYWKESEEWLRQDD